MLTAVFADEAALADGRVFVNRTRVRDAGLRVPAGAVVEVGAPSAGASAALAILHVQPELVVVDKPAGIGSVPDHHGTESLQAQVAAYCRLPLERVHPTSRLDRGVSGVVIFALQKSARDALAEARERGTYERLYLASRASAPAEAGEWTWPIGKDPRDPRKRRVHGKNPVAARTAFQVQARAPHGVLLALRPQTGRTHQLRVHAAQAGAPLDGDATYGGRTRFTAAEGDVVTLDRVALHAARVQVPWRGQVLTFRAPWPAALSRWWAVLGGSRGDER